MLARVACSLGLMLVACADVDPAEPRSDGAPSSGIQAEQPRQEGQSTGKEEPSPGGATESSSSLEDCVRRAVSKSGRESAVTELLCPGAAGASCNNDGPDLTQVSKLTNLRSLDLANRCVSDIGPLAGLKQLNHLELGGNQVSDIVPLGALRDLRFLGLANNPVSARRGWKRKEPFSQLARLEELNVDGVVFNHAPPLDALTSLQVLHQRRAQLSSIRVLGTLTNLRKLYLDGNEFGDLTPLEGLVQLEVLTATKNNISSAAPLERLAKAGQLREVLLDGNCVSSCSELESAVSRSNEPRADARGGAVISCEAQMTDCVGAEEYAGASALSVPVQAVDRYAPVLPIWTEAQVEQADALIRAKVAWDDPTGNCDGRAREAEAVLAEAKMPKVTEVYAFGDLRALTPNVPAGFVTFPWHVAVTLRTASGFVVLDPAFAERPISLRDWYARLVDSKDVPLNYSCTDHWSFLDDPKAYCRPDGSVSVDEDGNFAVDDVDDLRGTICQDVNCPL